MTALLDLAFTAEVIHWRGPSPFVFVAIPAEHADALRAAARRASYGWGMIPVEAAIRGHLFATALFPKDGSYLLPLKLKVREAIGASVGETVAVSLKVHPPRA